jgi:hypothetical protein
MTARVPRARLDLQRGTTARPVSTVLVLFCALEEALTDFS